MKNKQKILDNKNDNKPNHVNKYISESIFFYNQATDKIKTNENNRIN